MNIFIYLPQVVAEKEKKVQINSLLRSNVVLNLFFIFAAFS